MIRVSSSQDWFSLDKYRSSLTKLAVLPGRDSDIRERNRRRTGTDHIFKEDATDKSSPSQGSKRLRVDVGDRGAGASAIKIEVSNMHNLTQDR